MDILFCTIGAFTVQNLGSNIQVLICIVTKTSFKMLSTEMVIGFTIVYIICYLTCAAKIKNFPNISQNRVRVLWVAIISLCVCWLLQSWLISEKLDMVMACRVPFVFCCILSLFMQFGLLEQSRLNEENLALEQLIKENAKQYELSKKTVEIINMKCHDLKHRILELEQAGNADHGQLEEIRKAVDIYDGLAKTGCQPLDIILSEKNLLCEKYQIKFSYMIDGEKLTGIKSGDIAAIFGNALDNAIECAAELPVEKRIISLIGYARQDVMGIHIENYCEDELEFRNGLPVSTKGDDNYHGFGMKSIQYVVENMAEILWRKAPWKAPAINGLSSGALQNTTNFAHPRHWLSFVSSAVSLMISSDQFHCIHVDSCLCRTYINRGTYKVCLC